MIKKPSFIDIAGISFFIYSIYFGAGNLIFPIRIGYRVGHYITPAMIGFIVAAVILPALVVWACTRVDGGVEKVTAPLPRWFAVLIGILMYLIIGPLLGLPRFSGVAYTTLQPLLPDDNGGKTLPMIFSVIFFGATLALSINPARILQIVGKIMAPALVVVLLAIAISAESENWSVILSAKNLLDEEYLTSATSAYTASPGYVEHVWAREPQYAVQVRYMW